MGHTGLPHSVEIDLPSETTQSGPDKASESSWIWGRLFFFLFFFFKLDVLFGNLTEMVEFQVEFLKTLEDGVRLVPDLEKLEKVDQFKVSLTLKPLKAALLRHCWVTLRSGCAPMLCFRWSFVLWESVDLTVLRACRISQWGAFFGRGCQSGERGPYLSCLML